MVIDASKSPYYIVGDEKKDNGSGFMKLHKTMSWSKEHCIVFLPSGVILSSFTRWTYGVGSFKIIGNNTVLKSIYDGADEAQQRGLFAGEMMQNNVIEYIGKKEYVSAYPIKTARAGDTVITCMNHPFLINERLLIRSGDLFAGGYPRACRNFDWVKIKEVVGSGITLKMPLTEDYFDYDGAEIFSLDQTNYCDHAEFEGITFEGNFAYSAMKLILTDCNVTGWLWFSECQEIIANNVYAEKIEFDKLVGSVVANNLRTPSSPANGGSINSIVLNDCITGSIRLCPRYLETISCKIWANKVIKDEEKQLFDYAIPCIADPPARCPIRRLTIDRATFTTGPESQADKNLEFAPFEEIVI